MTNTLSQAMVLPVTGVVLIERGGKVVATGEGGGTGIIVATEDLLVFQGQAMARCPGSRQKKQCPSWIQCCHSWGVSLVMHLGKEGDECDV